MRIDYSSETNDLRINLDEGVGPSEDTVIVDREEGSIHLEFNRDGQLYGIGVIGTVEKLIPPRFLERFANRTAKPS